MSVFRSIRSTHGGPYHVLAFPTAAGFLLFPNSAAYTSRNRSKNLHSKFEIFDTVEGLLMHPSEIGMDDQTAQCNSLNGLHLAN